MVSWKTHLLQICAKVRESTSYSHIEGDYPLVVEASRHLVEAGGKRLRPLLTLIAAQFGESGESSEL
jgi:heptaprenyl diphosphate synthase